MSGPDFFVNAFIFSIILLFLAQIVQHYGSCEIICPVAVRQNFLLVILVSYKSRYIWYFKRWQFNSDATINNEVDFKSLHLIESTMNRKQQLFLLVRRLSSGSAKRSRLHGIGTIQRCNLQMKRYKGRETFDNPLDSNLKREHLEKEFRELENRINQNRIHNS